MFCLKWKLHNNRFPSAGWGRAARSRTQPTKVTEIWFHANWWPHSPTEGCVTTFHRSGCCGGSARLILSLFWTADTWLSPFLDCSYAHSHVEPTPGQKCCPYGSYTMKEYLVSQATRHKDIGAEAQGSAMSGQPPALLPASPPMGDF